MNRNLKYTTDNIADFYKSHRTHWSDFYESERTVLEGLGLNPETSVLDIGAACGGLGLALRERFGVTDYTGVEINPQAAEVGRNLLGMNIIVGDILDLQAEMQPRFDVIVSFGCIDWNIELNQMLEAAFNLVRPGGFFLSSFRLTEKQSVTDMATSFQYINFAGSRTGEKAPYVVMTLGHLMAMLALLSPQKILGYGYYGPPSASAVTPFESVCFSVFALRKRLAGEVDEPPDLRLPHTIIP